MIEVNLTNVVSGYNLNDINDNFVKIKEALEKAVSKDSSVNNSLEVNLDMDGNDIINIGTLDGDRLTINGQQVLVSELSVVSFGYGGTWADATGYLKDVIVSNDGNSYISKVAHTSSTDSEPGVGASWSDSWQLLSSKGDKGDKGDTGASGTGSGDLVASQNLADVDNVDTARANLNAVSQDDFDVLDAAALLDSDVGTGANDIVQLDASSRLPAVDGSQLTNLPSGGQTKAFSPVQNGTASWARAAESSTNKIRVRGGIVFSIKSIANTVNGDPDITIRLKRDGVTQNSLYVEIDEDGCPVSGILPYCIEADAGNTSVNTWTVDWSTNNGDNLNWVGVAHSFCEFMELEVV